VFEHKISIVPSTKMDAHGLVQAVCSCGDYHSSPSGSPEQAQRSGAQHAAARIIDWTMTDEFRDNLVADLDKSFWQLYAEARAERDLEDLYRRIDQAAGHTDPATTLPPSSEMRTVSDIPAGKHTPEEWCSHYHVQVIDPDGWRGADGVSWNRPVDLPEFWRRLGRSTARQLDLGAWDRIHHDLNVLINGQPDPVPNDMPHVADLVVADIRVRKAQGLAEYGTPLQPRNGRLALRDLYEEILDAAHYLRQEIWERENPNPAALSNGTGGVEWGVHYPSKVSDADPYPVDWCDSLADARGLAASQPDEPTVVVTRPVGAWRGVA